MSIADKLATIAENEQRVYEAGKKTQEQDFWDTYQQNGERTTYTGAFAGRGWVDEIFKPKYNMKPSTANFMFYASSIKNLTNILEERKITIDFSNCTNFENAFSSLATNKLGVIDIRKATNTYTAIAYNGGLKTIEKLIVSENTPFNKTFINSLVLTNLTIEGTIGKNGFDVSSCTKLSKTSIISIINALSDTTSGLTVTLSKKAVNDAFETTPGASDGSQSAEWDLLIATKPKWKISLVE